MWFFLPLVPKHELISICAHGNGKFDRRLGIDTLLQMTQHVVHANPRYTTYSGLQAPCLVDDFAFSTGRMILR